MGRYTGDIPTETDPLMEGEEGYPHKDRRRKCCIICVIVTCVLLLLVALLTYFLFPRIPEVQVNSDEIVVKQWSWSSSGVAMDIFVPVSVYNPNYLPLTLSLTQCNIYYMGEHLAYGKPLSRTQFGSGTTTNVTVEILVLDSMRNNSNIANMLTAECGYPPSSSKSVRMELKATVKVTIVADDISVPFSSAFSLPCAI